MDLDLSTFATAVLTQLLETAVLTKNAEAVRMITAELSTRY